MKYNIGDKVKLKNESIVTITDIPKTLDMTSIYLAGNIPIEEDDIIEKID